jgi:hypothetical protein
MDRKCIHKKNLFKKITATMKRKLIQYTFSKISYGYFANNPRVVIGDIFFFSRNEKKKISLRILFHFTPGNV